MLPVDSTAATAIVKRTADVPEGLENDVMDDMSDDSSSSVEKGEDHERPKTSKIVWLVQQIYEQIQSLFYLSSLLRRPTFTGKYIRSVSRKATASQGEEEFSLAFCFSKFDFQHVVEKLRQWRSLVKDAEKLSDENEEPVPHDRT